jgi:hypothetical protein
LHTDNSELRCKSGYLSLAGHSGNGYKGKNEYSRNQQGKLELEIRFEDSPGSCKKTLSANPDVRKDLIDDNHLIFTFPWSYNKKNPGRIPGTKYFKILLSEFFFLF